MSALDGPTALVENAFREREFAFRCDSFVLFADTLDPITRIVGIPVRGRNETANLIGTKGSRSKHRRLELDYLTDIELMRHQAFLWSYWGMGNSLRYTG